MPARRPDPRALDMLLDMMWVYRDQGQGSRS